MDPGHESFQAGKIPVKGRKITTVCMPQTFGKSAENESSWEDCLCEAHRDFVLEFMELEQAREEAAVNRWLESAMALSAE
jgi:hypothetical protein